MKILDLPENWNVLLEKLTGLGEQIFGKNYYPELQDRLADLERIQSLLNESNDVIFLVEASSGNLVDANAPACLQMGRSRDELLEMSLYELCDPSTAIRLADIFKQASQETPEKPSLIGALRRKDRYVIPMEIHLKRVALGEKAYVVVVGKDITDRRKAEEALRENREYHLNTLDAIPDLVYELALDGTIIYANRTASEALGIESDQHGTIRFADLLDQAGAERSLGEFRRISETKCPSQNVFYRLKAASGAKLPVEVHATLLERKDQPPTILCVARDITYRRQLESRFRQSQRMEAVGRLAGGIAHDFNNLMTAIIGYSDIMLLNLREGDPLRQRVEEIRKAGDMANSLTRQLMAFTRKQFLQPKVIKLNEVIADMEKVLQRFIGEDIDLVTDLDPSLGHVKSDKSQMEQVILNLTLNSRDAMSQGGKILIETRNVELDEAYAAQHIPLAPGPYVMLALTDTGTGMDEETQAHIFEPFYTKKEKEMGTGLGLSTVYGTVKQSGGFIWVYSELDRGTTFKIYLPRVKEEEIPAEPPSPPPPTNLEGSETVLLVEDQDSLREMACEVLRKKGYKVLDARNAGEAILISEEHTGLIHLMLTDVVMPRVGGRELFERLQPWHPEMKVLFMSGYTDNAVVQQGLLEQGAAFLEKPFSPEDLARNVRQVLDTSRGSG